MSKKEKPYSKKGMWLIYDDALNGDSSIFIPSIIATSIFVSGLSNITTFKISISLIGASHPIKVSYYDKTGAQDFVDFIMKCREEFELKNREN